MERCAAASPGAVSLKKPCSRTTRDQAGPGLQLAVNQPSRHSQLLAMPVNALWAAPVAGAVVAEMQRWLTETWSRKRFGFASGPRP